MDHITLSVLLATAITAGAVSQEIDGIAADVNATSEVWEYIIALLGQTIQSETTASYSDISYKVVVSGEDGVKVKFTTADWNNTATIEHGSYVESFTLKNSMNGTEIANKSIKVSSNKMVTVQVFTYASNYVEGYLALPVASLNVLYQVSTFCSLSGFCQIAIASTVPGITKVYLQFPLRVPEIVFCVGKRFYRSKRDRFFQLAEFEVLQIETAADLTGTYIFSEHPVAVFAGTRNLTVGGAITHMVEQLAPAHNWGKEFVLKTLGNTAYGDIIKITAIHSKTTVNIKGFSSFVIANSNHTVSRLLKPGAVSHIKSDKAIQVVQFTGLINNVTDDVPSFSPSMTVVPPTSSYQKEFRHYCNRGDKAYILALPKTETEFISINSKQLGQTRENVMYSSYSLVTQSIDATGDLTRAKTSGDMPFGGVLICGKTAIMPMSLGLKVPKKEKKKKECKEDLTFDVQVDVRRPVPIPHRLEGIGKIDLIKLRVQTCGHAGVILERNQTRVILNIMHKNVIVTKCEPHCNNTNVYGNEYNDVPDRNCTVDMSFFWIRQYRKSEKKVCLGYGPYQDDVCEQKLITSKTFKTMKLTGFSGSVHFNYDLHVGECDKTISDWRCQDLVDNCDLYEESICSDPHFEEWVMKNCRKYCGKCHPDVYGRRFLVLVPEQIHGMGLSECEIHVTALASGTHIAVGSKEKVIVSTRQVKIKSSVSISTDYNCGPTVSTTPITVIADKTVFVTVVFSSSMLGNTNYGTFQVYPVDTAGTEIISFTDNSEQSSCRLAALDYPTIFVCHFGRSRGRIAVDSGDLKDGLSYTLNPGSVRSIKASGRNDLTGILFQSDKPMYLFCGTSPFEANNADFYQILSAEYLGRRYVTPSPLPKDDVHNKDLTLRIQAYQDNTKVTLKDSEEIIITLNTTGDFEDRNLTGPYTIESNNKIAVALVIQDLQPGSARSFIILAATSQYLNKSEFQVYIPLYASDIVYIDVEPETLKSLDVTGTDTHLETRIPEEDQMYYYRVVETPGIAYTISVVANNITNKWLAFAGSMPFPVAKDLETCVTRPEMAGDGEDNDCDGREDEDECFSGYGVYGSDNDEDGGFSDDCLKNATTLPILQQPPDPPCMPINKPAGQCWKVSSNCKCSWVAALKAKDDMTEDERNVQIEADKERYKAELTLDTKKLSSSTSQRKSTGDKRQSAANFGYVAITFFALLFGLIVLLDLKSLIRDFKTLVSNLKDGFGRLWDYINGE